MSTEYLKLTAYVNRASELAECVQADLKAGQKISTKTIAALARFIKAADNVKDMLEEITEIDPTLN
jgi:hypothetical protein